MEQRTGGRTCRGKKEGEEHVVTWKAEENGGDFDMYIIKQNTEENGGQFELEIYTKRTCGCWSGIEYMYLKSSGVNMENMENREKT